MNALTDPVLLKESRPPPPPRGWLVPLLRRMSRPLRMVLAVGILAIGIYAILAERGYIASDSAVVTAYHVALRTPIDGQVRGMTGDVGQHLPGGSVLARVSNDRLDEWRLAELRGQQARLTAERGAAEGERDMLLAIRATLLSRTEAHSRATRARLLEEAEEAAHAARARAVQRDQSQQELERRLRLAGAGVVPLAELERHRRLLAAAEHELAAALQHAAVLRRRAGDAGQGIFTDAGGTDIAYSAQRIDDIAVRLAAIGRDIRALAAQESELTGRIAAEAARSARQRDVDLATDHEVMLWRLAAAEGERLAAGDTVAEVVQCDAAFLIVNVAQQRLPDVAVGGIARFRLTGETMEREGRVLTISGPTDPADQRKMAASLPPALQPVGAVRVALAPARGECLIGRHARVLLPTGFDDPMSGWRRWLAGLFAGGTPRQFAGTP